MTTAERILNILRGAKRRIPVQEMLDILAGAGVHITSRELRKQVGEIILNTYECVGVDEGGYYMAENRHNMELAKSYRMKPAITTIRIAEKLEKNYEYQEQEKLNKSQLSLEL